MVGGLWGGEKNMRVRKFGRFGDTSSSEHVGGTCVVGDLV